MQSQHNRLRRLLAANAELTMGIVEAALPQLDIAASAIAQSYLADGKLITCGCGSASAISEYCAAIFADQLEQERPGLPALALSSSAIVSQSITHTSSTHEVYARQIRAHGMANDCLLIFGASRDSAAIVQLVSAAHDRGVQVIAVTGEQDANLASLLTPEDIEIRIQTNSPARLTEAELLISHGLCECVESHLFGLGEPG